VTVVFVFRPTWQVQDKPMANNVAYTSGKLSLHTDYPALHAAPGVSKTKHEVTRALVSAWRFESSLGVRNKHVCVCRCSCCIASAAPRKGGRAR